MVKSLNQQFEPDPDHIKRICRFFGLGKLLREDKAKSLSFPHANAMIFVTTSRGRFVLKFYPEGDAKKIAFEYAVNRILAGRRFPTPVMHIGSDNRPFIFTHERLAVCYSFIEGCSAWKIIQQEETFRRINRSLLSLKDTLSGAKIRIPWPQNESLAACVNILTRYSRTGAPIEGKKIIEGSLLGACRTYQRHRRLFTRVRLQSDANLTNFLMDKDTVYILDLEHVREDYALSDLSSLLVSCILSLPLTTIKVVIKDYFTRHKLTAEYFSVLDALVKIGLAKEYLVSPDAQRKKSIAALLTKLNDDPRHIV